MEFIFLKISSYYKKQQHLFNIGVLILITFLVFANSLNAYFSEVDDLNSFLHSNIDWKKVLFTNTYGYDTGGNYRPMEVIIHQLDRFLYGSENYFGRHFTNILVHIFNVLLVYCFAFTLTKNKVIGFTSGLLFAVSMVNGNTLSPVGWITGRIDPFVTLFLLITLLLLSKYLSSKLKVFYVVSLIFFCLALLTKEMALTFPILSIFFILFLYGIKKEEHLTKAERYYPILIFILSIVSILFAIILSPNIVAKLISSDGMLANETISKIQSFRGLIFIISVFLLIISLLSKYSKAFLRFIASTKYTIPYFLLVLIYMLTRLQVIGGVGGNYSLKDGENQIFQFGIDSFMRDTLGLIGLIYPAGNDYNIKIFQLQIENPITFYLVSGIIILSLILIFVRLVKVKSYTIAFFFTWIFITLAPVHNSIIAIGQYQSRYLYLPAVGFSIFISILLYNFTQSKNISKSITKPVVMIAIIIIATFNSFFIIKTNDKMRMSGEVMRVFVSDIRKFKNDIASAEHIYFINFPISPINSLDAVFTEFLLHEALNFLDDLEGYKKIYNYSVLLYTQEENPSVHFSWLNDKSFIIGGLDASKNYIIPDQISTRLEKEIERIYTVKPHPKLRSIKSIGEVKESKDFLLRITDFDEASKKIELKGELKLHLRGTLKNSVFFIYNDGRFLKLK